VAARIAGKRFVFPSNPPELESIQFEPPQEGTDVAFVVRVAGKDQRIVCGRGAWVKGSLSMGHDGPVPIAASGAWTSDDTYTAMLCRYQTPFTTTYDVRFSRDGVILEMEDNVGLESTSRVRMTGKAQP
jgi:hypothetical protein